MGGAQGHLNHISDNRNLTFKEIKKILSLASSGKLEMTEKTDGAAIALSFRNGQATYARNKGDLLALGRDIKDLVNREFVGGDNVKNAYIAAFKAYQSAINKMSPNLIQKLFQNGTIFYSSEIQGPAFSNVINYDKNILSIHKTGHKIVNSETGEIRPFEDDKMDRMLDKAIDSIEQEQEPEKFKIARTAILKLNNLSNDKDLQIAKAKIDKIINSANISDNQTIEDYLRIALYSYVENELPPEIDKKIVSLVVENILGNTKLVDILPKGTSKELRSRISQIKKNSKFVIQKTIRPIEEVIHDFAVEMLKGMESSYILNNKKEIDRLRKEVAKAIKIIQSSNNENAIEILNYQLSKLKDIENINTAIEGVVFQYKGNVYKFTGNFAPINQILGMFRYGRGKDIPKFEKDKDVDEGKENINKKSNRVIAAIPGGYKPPHAGHYDIAKYFANSPQVNLVYILISPKDRTGHSIDNQISIDKNMSLKLWKLYTKNDSKIRAIISSSPSPVKSVYDFMEKLNPGDTYILAKGEKEVEGDTRFDRAQEWSNKNNLGINVEIINVPTMAEGISGTKMRELIAAGDEKKFKKFIPQHLTPEEKNIAWSIVNRQDNVFENIIFNAINKTVYKKIDEISAMSAGSIEGAATKGTSKTKTNNDNQIKEEDKYMINRKDFIQEMELRQKIRESIKFVRRTRCIKKIKRKLEENKIRNHVRIILSEKTKPDDETPHHSTGINILEDLLKKIIPVLEENYKTLTTSIQQRQSFRSHIINAIQNSIRPDASRDLSDKKDSKKFISIAEDGLEIDEEEDINVNIGNDEEKEEDKFIDIEGKPAKSEEEKEEEDFTLHGEDLTGRNVALNTYERIETIILDSYNLLSDEEDINNFYSYLLTNIKLYFDKFEDELKITMNEPTTSEYEDKINNQTSEVSGEELEDIEV